MILLKNCFVATTQNVDFVPIIHDVRLALRDSTVIDGLVTISIPGSGAGLLISDLTLDNLKKEVEKFKNLGVLIPSLSLPFQKKELLLDPKQMIYLVDATDTKRRREFYVQLMGEEPPKPQNPQQGGKTR